MFKRLFWNPEERRIAAIWRIVLQLILMFVLILIPQFILGIFIGISGLSDWQNSLWIQPLMDFMTMIGMAGGVLLAGYLFDRRRLRDFGFRFREGWWRDFWFGMALGAVLMGLVFGIEYLLGYVSISDTFVVANPQYSFPLLIIAQAILFLFVGIQEEMLSRGYHLKNLAEGLNSINFISPKLAVIIAMVLSSAVFGLLHANNPNASFISTFNIFIAGLMLALGFLWTKQLAIPIGLHITWNFFQGNVFGFPVSGTNSNATSVLEIAQTGPEWFTGGAFGPEAGVIGLIMMAVGVFAIWLYTRNYYIPTEKMAGLAIPEFSKAHQENLENGIVADGESIEVSSSSAEN